MSEIARLALLIVSLAYISLGVVVYQRAPDRVWNRIFAVHALGVSVWVFLNYLIQSADTVVAASTYIRLTHPFAALGVCTTLDLAWVFPERMRPAPWSRRFLLYAIGLGCSAVGLAPNLLTSVELTAGTVIVEYGWPFIIFGLFTMTTVGYADVILLGKARRLAGLRRIQVIYFLVGLIAAQIAAITTMVLLPLAWHNSYYSRWGPASYIFMALSMSYAIGKYQIVKPKVALLRGAAYVLTGGLLAGVTVTTVVILQSFLEAGNIPLVLAYLVAGILMGIVAVPVHGYLHRLFTGLARRHSRERESVQYTSDAILRTLDADQILEFLADMTMQLLKPTHVCVLLKDPLSGDFVIRAHRMAGRRDSFAPLEFLAAQHVLVVAAARHRALLDRDHVFRFRSLREAKRISAAMERYGLQILVPILWEDELVGLICVGEKRTGEMYEAEELASLSGTTPQVSLALRNAQLYAEMSRYREFEDKILREMETGVIAVNGAGKVVLYNPAAARILGLPPEQVLEHSVLELPPGIRDRLREALEGATPRAGEQEEITRPDGEAVPISCKVSRLGGPGAGPDWGAVAVIHDLTLVRELEHERQEAERLSMIRVLAAGMAHEIRNPLVAIRTFAELLPHRWDDSEFRSTFMTTAQGEVDRIVGLVNELLMLSRPAGSVTKPINVGEVCAGVLRALSPLAESRGVRLIAHLPRRALWSRGDPGRLHQAIVNLVTNAVDAEPQDGEVAVSAEETHDPKENGRVLIRVRNPHSYIPPEQAEEIFKPFVSKKEGGTGLGLAICQTIVEEHKGTIEVHSDPESGTEFVVRLPASSEAEGSASPGA